MKDFVNSNNNSSASTNKQMNANFESNSDVLMNNCVATEFNGKVAVPKHQPQQDPFWSKEAQTISELPKVLSVFYNEDGKLQRTSYILNYRDNKSLNDIIMDLKKLFQIHPNQNSDDIKWKLYNMNGQPVKRTQDLYFQFASSFLLCKKSVALKLPSVDHHSSNNLVTNGQIDKRKVNKLPNVHQFRPTSNTTDFLGRRNIGGGQSPVKPYLSKREMGWIFGTSNLKIVEPERKRKTRSISPTAKKLAYEEIMKKVEEKPPKIVKIPNPKVQSAANTKRARVTIDKRSLSADDKTKNLDLNGGLVKTQKKLLKQQQNIPNTTDMTTKKKKTKKSQIETSTIADDKNKLDSERKEEKINQELLAITDVHIEKASTDVKLTEEATEPETKPEIISAKTGSATARTEPLFSRPVDLFGVPLQNVPVVRRGSLPLKNWVIPITGDSNGKSSSDTTNIVSNKQQTIASSRSILKTSSLDNPNVKSVVKENKIKNQDLVSGDEKVKIVQNALESRTTEETVNSTKRSQVSPKSTKSKFKNQFEHQLESPGNVGDAQTVNNSTEAAHRLDKEFETLFNSQQNISVIEQKEFSLGTAELENKVISVNNGNEPLALKSDEKLTEKSFTDEFEKLFPTAVKKTIKVEETQQKLSTVSQENETANEAEEKSLEIRENTFVKQEEHLVAADAADPEAKVVS